jgi:hypothetical protein
MSIQPTGEVMSETKKKRGRPPGPSTVRLSLRLGEAVSEKIREENRKTRVPLKDIVEMLLERHYGLNK